MDTIDIIRTALLITLPVTLLAVLYKRFKLRTLHKEMPAAAHAELIGLEVAYHPPRLKAWVKVPAARRIRTAVLDGSYREIHRWEDQQMDHGEHWIDRPLPSLADGSYHFEISTGTQRTVRRFHLLQA